MRCLSSCRFKLRAWPVLLWNAPLEPLLPDLELYGRGIGCLDDLINGHAVFFHRDGDLLHTTIATNPNDDFVAGFKKRFIALSGGVSIRSESHLTW